MRLTEDDVNGSMVQELMDGSLVNIALCLDLFGFFDRVLGG